MDPESFRTVKQVIVIRRDLGMRRGKEIAQGAHAAMAWLRERLDRYTVNNVPTGLWMAKLSAAEQLWMNGSFAKVVCQVDTEADLRAVVARATGVGVQVFSITDEGRTEFGGIPTLTAVAVGPDWSMSVDKVTGDLKLY